MGGYNPVETSAVFPATMSSIESHPCKGLEQPDTNNATWFNPKEKALNTYWKEDDYWLEPSAFRFQKQRDWWTYLEELNQGIRNGKWTNNPYWTYRDNRDLIDNVSEQIGATAKQGKKAKEAYFHLHNRYISGVRKDATAVAVVAYIIENDGADDRRFHPQVVLKDGEEVADYLATQFSIESSIIQNVYGKVQHYLRIEKPEPEPMGFDDRNMDRRGLYIGRTSQFNRPALEAEGGGI